MAKKENEYFVANKKKRAFWWIKVKYPEIQEKHTVHIRNIHRLAKAISTEIYLMKALKTDDELNIGRMNLKIVLTGYADFFANVVLVIEEGRQ